MKSIGSIELKELLDAGKSITIIDVREPYETQVCSLDIAIQIPMGEIVERREELPTQTQLVIMCMTGKRAAAVANLLEADFNIPNVIILDGGLTAWVENVQPELSFI